MRNTISLWACLVLFCGTILATEPSNTTPVSKDENKETSTIDNNKKARINYIPNRDLEVQVLNSKNLLHINLTGKSEQLDWIIFQPKGEIISKISTAMKIDEIKIDNLEAGQYVLMIKDQEGRMLFKNFVKA